MFGIICFDVFIEESFVFKLLKLLLLIKGKLSIEELINIFSENGNSVEVFVDIFIGTLLL